MRGLDENRGLDQQEHGNPFGRQLVGNVPGIRKVADKPVELGHHEGIAGSGRRPLTCLITKDGYVIFAKKLRDIVVNRSAIWRCPVSGI